MKTRMVSCCSAGVSVAQEGMSFDKRHLFRQPEIAGQTVPDFEILVVLDTVPVDGAHAADRS